MRISKLLNIPKNTVDGLKKMLWHKAQTCKVGRWRWERGKQDNTLARSSGTQSDPDKKRRLPLIKTGLRIISLNPRVPVFLRGRPTGKKMRHQDFYFIKTVG